MTGLAGLNGLAIQCLPFILKKMHENKTPFFCISHCLISNKCLKVDFFFTFVETTAPPTELYVVEVMAIFF